MDDTTTTAEQFEPQWGIVEVMGHQRHAGLISQRSIFGTVFCQIDVPELPTYIDRWGEEHPAQSAYSKLVGGSAIFAITPTTEEIARAAARTNTKAVNVYLGEMNPMPPRQLAVITGGEDRNNADDENDENEDYFDNPFANS
jgi:hypothetical protein